MIFFTQEIPVPESFTRHLFLYPCIIWLTYSYRTIKIYNCCLSIFFNWFFILFLCITLWRDQTHSIRISRSTLTLIPIVVPTIAPPLFFQLLQPSNSDLTASLGTLLHPSIPLFTLTFNSSCHFARLLCLSQQHSHRSNRSLQQPHFLDRFSSSISWGSWSVHKTLSIDPLINSIHSELIAQHCILSCHSSQPLFPPLHSR